MPLYGPNFLLTSTMYPVEVEEMAAVLPPTFGAVLWETDLSDIDVAAPLFSATLIQTLFSGQYNMPPEDFAEVANPSFTGVLERTVWTAQYNMPNEDFAEISFPIFSAQLVQTLFPLSYSMPPEDFAGVNVPAFTGSLI